VRSGCTDEPSPSPPLSIESDQTPTVFARDGELSVYFDDAATFVVAAGGERVTCHSQGTDGATVRHLLLDQLLPRLIAADELAVLHASGVLVDGGVVAFVAPSGGGKSTLAVMLGRLGTPIVSDDALVVRATPGGVLAVPSYPGLRLAPAMIATLDEPLETVPLGDGSTKQRILTGGALRFAAKAAPLRSIAVLARTDRCAPDVTPLHGAFAVDAVLRAAFPPLDRSDEARLFTKAAALADSVPVLRLEIPTDVPGHRVLDAVLGARS
jgi:hypothetical protein